MYILSYKAIFVCLQLCFIRYILKIEQQNDILLQKYYYTIIDLCFGRHGVILNSKRHIERRGAEVNMIRFTVQ